MSRWSAASRGGNDGRPVPVNPGSSEGLAWLYVGYQRRLRRYASRRFGDNDADDLVQETLIRAWHRLDGRDLTEDLWPWLSRILRNVAVDMHRSRKRIVPVDIRVVYEQTADGTDVVGEVLSNEQVRHVHRALMRLPPQDRVLLAACADGASLEEVAARYGVTVGALRVRLFRARKRLRTTLKTPGRLGVAVLAFHRGRPRYRPGAVAAAGAVTSVICILATPALPTRTTPTDVFLLVEFMPGARLNLAEMASRLARTRDLQVGIGVVDQGQYRLWHPISPVTAATYKAIDTLCPSSEVPRRRDHCAWTSPPGLGGREEPYADAITQAVRGDRHQRAGFRSNVRKLIVMLPEERWGPEAKSSRAEAIRALVEERVNFVGLSLASRSTPDEDLRAVALGSATYLTRKITCDDSDTISKGEPAACRTTPERVVTLVESTIKNLIVE